MTFPYLSHKYIRPKITLELTNIKIMSEVHRCSHLMPSQNSMLANQNQGKHE